MEKIWKVIPKIFAAVRKDHEDVGLTGSHDFVHAARVGELAMRIAFDEWGDMRTAIFAGAAGLCHNADRILQKKFGLGRKEVPRDDVEELVFSQLAAESRPSLSGLEDHQLVYFSEGIINAVTSHDNHNGEGDSPVLIALMDADRIVNLDIDHLLRVGQYCHDTPAVDYKYFLDDPEATYRSSKSALKEASYSLDWVDQGSPVCVRTRLGKKMAEERAKVYRMFFSILLEQLEEEGIRPYPFD